MLYLNFLYFNKGDDHIFGSIALFHLQIQLISGNAADPVGNMGSTRGLDG